MKKSLLRMFTALNLRCNEKISYQKAIVNSTICSAQRERATLVQASGLEKPSKNRVVQHGSAASYKFVGQIRLRTIDLFVHRPEEPVSLIPTRES